MSSNLDFLRTAVHVKKDMKNVESDNVVDGKIRKDSREFNQIFLDPYKSAVFNIAGRLRSVDGNAEIDSSYMYHIDGIVQTIKSYIVMNLRDTMISTASSFIDDLSTQFIYNATQYDQHYEYEFPYGEAISNDKDLAEDLFEEVFGHDSNEDLYHLILKNIELSGKKALTIQARIGIYFDSLYSATLRRYFDSIVVKTAKFYISKPDMIKDFYESFLGDHFTPFAENGYNNAYSYITIALRDMMKPHLEDFKDCLYIMSNTVSSMVIGYDLRSYDMTYEEYLKKNPFAYEIYLEKFNNKEEEEDFEENGESDYDDIEE